MQVNAQQVIDELTKQLGQLNTELTVQRLMVDELSAENAKLKLQIEQPTLLEGTIA